MTVGPLVAVTGCVDGGRRQEKGQRGERGQEVHAGEVEGWVQVWAWVGFKGSGSILACEGSNKARRRRIGLVSGREGWIGMGRGREGGLLSKQGRDH